MNVCKAIFLALVMVCAWSAAPKSSTAAEPYSLGVALGLTGTGAPWSKESLNGIRIAVDEINAAGGFLGQHRITLAVANTRTDPKTATRVVDRLIKNDDVRAVIGTYSSSTALAIKPICRDNGVLHIAPISNSEDITKLDFSPYTFSVVPNTYMISRAVARAAARLAEENGWQTYATIASNYDWGQSSQTVQVTELSRTNPSLTLVAELWPPLGHVSFNAYAVNLMNDKPDFVLESVAGADKARWDLTVRDYRLDDTIALPGAITSVTELINQAPYIRRGSIRRTRAPFFAHLDVPMMTGFIEAYRAQFGLYPSDWAVMGYDSVQALRQGIEAAASIDSETVKDAMKGLSIETTRGQHTFREIDNQLDVSAYIGRVADHPDYEFPIYDDLIVFEAQDIWRSEEEILAARAK
jgi:branched-chain amino acid transport system substrate-binding protein